MRFGAAIAAAFVAVFIPLSGMAAERAERPTYQVGERWFLDRGEFTLTAIHRDAYVFKSDRHEIHLSRDLLPVKIVRGGRTEWEMDPAPAIRWPLEVGRWGVGRTSVLKDGREVVFSVSNTTSKEVQVTWKVEARETRVVAGRSLDTFRISIGLVAGPAAYSIPGGSFTLWYAPEVRQILKMDGSGSLAFNPVEVVSLGGAPATAEAKPAAPTTVEPPPAPKPAPAEIARVTPPKPAEIPGQPAIAPAPVTPAPVTPKPTETKPAIAPAPAPKPVVVTPAAPETRPGSSSTPLRLVLSSPADNSRVQQDSLGLAGVVTGGEGTRQVLVTLNGAAISQIDQPAARTGFPLNVPVTLREGPNTLVVTITDASGQTQQQARTVTFEKVVPLTLSVNYPADQLRLTQNSTVVVASAASGRGVAKVSVSINGLQVAEQTAPNQQRSLPLTVPITLNEGANAIVVVATDADGTVRQEVRTVFYDAPRIAGFPPPKIEVREQWAVVIGVGSYDSRAIPPLRYATADAEAVYRTLLDSGFKKENVMLLTERTERKPTVRDIKYALGTFLARSAKKDDLVLIFFAGHGAPETDPRGLERDGLAKYLIPMDADPDDLYSTAFPMDELQTIFGRLESERVVAFLDTCYSGAVGGRTFTVKRTRSGAVDDLFLERLTRSRGRVIVTASRANEVSVELPDLGHGVFTYYLVQGLKGAADGNRDGIVSLQELYEYVEQQVVRKSRSVGSPQHPVMKGEFEGPLPLIRLTRPAR